MTEQNPMTKISVEKVTLNIGTGRDTDKLEKAKKLLENITGIEPVTTKSKERIAEWGLRPGLPVGCKITLRGDKAEETLRQLLTAQNHELPESCFDDYGNVSFGISEYVSIEDMDYDTDIGMMGLQVSVTLERPGYRVKKRENKQSDISKDHRINHSEAITFMEDEYDVQVKA